MQAADPSGLSRLLADRTLSQNMIHGTHCRWTPVEVDSLAWPLHHIPLLCDPSPQQRDTERSKRTGSFKGSYTRFKIYRNYLQKGFLCLSFALELTEKLNKDRMK